MTDRDISMVKFVSLYTKTLKLNKKKIIKKNFEKFDIFSKNAKFDHVFNRNDKYYSLVSINPGS